MLCACMDLDLYIKSYKQEICQDTDELDFQHSRCIYVNQIKSSLCNNEWLIGVCSFRRFMLPTVSNISH